MKKILIQLDSDKFTSVFDAITAYDAGVDHILQYSGIEPKDVRNLVYGAMFTRGGKALKNSAAFIGGSDVSLGEEVMEAVCDSFFGPVRVSVMLDSNGCNTTAVAAVRKIVSKGSIEGRKIVILGGTGPVGVRAAALMVQEGAQVFLSSRTLEKSEKACAGIEKRFGIKVAPKQVSNGEELTKILDSAYAVLCTGAAGITLIQESVWQALPDLRVLADVNAVPPLGIENTKPHWDGKEIGYKMIFGALGIGGLKMEIHKECITRLFTQNDLKLDAEEIYGIAKAMDQK
jgi:hypothetical protein